MKTSETAPGRNKAGGTREPGPGPTGAPPDEPLYERMAVARGAGAPLRPGGLHLTLRAVDACAFPEGARLLDVGCGTGATVETLASERGLRCFGTDPSAALVRMGRQRNPGLEVVLGRGEALPFGDGTLDGVLLECVLSLAEDPARVLEEVRRVLRPGGRVIVTDIHARAPECVPDLRRFALDGCVRGALPLEDLKGEFHALGFSIDLIEDHSRELKEFAARLILTGGFPEGFWCRSGGAGGGRGDARAARDAVAAARPGYFLLLAS